MDRNNLSKEQLLELVIAHDILEDLQKQDTETLQDQLQESQVAIKGLRHQWDKWKVATKIGLSPDLIYAIQKVLTPTVSKTEVVETPDTESKLIFDNNNLGMKNLNLEEEVDDLKGEVRELERQLEIERLTPNSETPLETETSDWLEIRNQAHLMDAEFSSDKEPTKEKIEKLILEKGYVSTDIEIWFDALMKFWRASANITEPETPKANPLEVKGGPDLCPVNAPYEKAESLVETEKENWENIYLLKAVLKAVQLGLGMCDLLDGYENHETADNMRARFKSLIPHNTQKNNEA